MRIIRMILQVGVFLCLAGYFLMLLAGRKPKLGDLLLAVSASPTVQTQGFKLKMSPIERMREAQY